MAMHLVGKIVPKDFQAQFRETPADFGLYGVIADYLEERGDKVKDALCFRAAAGRRWRAFGFDPEPGDWTWYAITTKRLTGHCWPHSQFTAGLTGLHNENWRHAFLPPSIQETLLDAWRGHSGEMDWPHGPGHARGFVWATYRSEFQAQAALLTALRAVDNRRLNEWARLRT